MTKKFEAIADTVLALPRKQRQLLAEQLIDSLPVDTQLEIERAWIDEVERRYKDVDEGRVKTIPVSRVLREIKARLKR